MGRVVPHGNRHIVTNAGALFAASMVTAGSGFVYWVLAARLYPEEGVGNGSAAIAAMTLLGTIGMLGLGTVLIAELARQSDEPVGLVTASLISCGLASAILGLAYAVVVPMVSPDLGVSVAGPGRALLFSVGVGLTGATFVLDQALVGVLRAGLQLWRNLAFSVAKLVLLVGVSLVARDQLGTGIMASWVLGVAVSVGVLAVIIVAKGGWVFARPQWSQLRRLKHTAFLHNWLNLATQGPRLLMPVLVTALISAEANAAFYAAWMIVGFLALIPTHFSTVLFAVGAGDARLLSQKVRFTMRTSTVVGGAATVACIVLAYPVLRVMGPTYAAEATLALQILALTYFPTIVKTHYIAVVRIRGQMLRGATLLTAGSVLEMAAGAIGAVLGGVTGVAIGVLLAMIVETVAFGPPVLGLVRTGGATVPVNPGTPGLSPSR